MSLYYDVTSAAVDLRTLTWHNVTVAKERPRPPHHDGPPRMKPIKPELLRAHAPIPVHGIYIQGRMAVACPPGDACIDCGDDCIDYTSHTRTFAVDAGRVYSDPMATRDPWRGAVAVRRPIRYCGVRGKAWP